jgi:hypothetical protein
MVIAMWAFFVPVILKPVIFRRAREGAQSMDKELN